VHDGVDQQALRIDENVALLALDLFSRIVTRRIDRRPPFSALLTLWLSMTAAVGLASRPIASRHIHGWSNAAAGLLEWPATGNLSTEYT
jgi:hypothetical protein